ncbi:MAG: hypothetical protein AAF975_03210, partial [Spirochaetota bacterium]
AHKALVQAQTFSPQDTVQFPMGLILDLGIQTKFNRKFGMGINTYVHFYFSGQEQALDAVTWSYSPIYQGAVGTSVSFLLFP